MREAAPDFLFSFYYRRMLPPALLALARRGAYNMHGSLLPKYRGRVPVNWAILLGETETGATLHEMVEKPDAGRIVDQKAVPIGPDDQALEVFRKVTGAAEAVLRRSLPRPDRGHRASCARRTSRAAATSAGAGRRTAASTGRRAPPTSTTWCAPSRRRIPGRSPRMAGACAGSCARGIEPGRRAQPGRLGPYREGDAWFADCGDGRVLRLLQVDPPT